MGVILDTAILIDLERNVISTIKQIEILCKIDPKPNISFFTYAEYLYGIKYKSEENQQILKTRLKLYKCLHTTNITSEIVAELQHKYDKIGINIQLPDLIIASQANEHNLTLVTKDKQLEKIKEIKTIIIS